MSERGLEIYTPDELYAAMIIFPLAGSAYEAATLRVNNSVKDPIKPLGWAAYWRDMSSYQQGYSVVRLLQELSDPHSIWKSEQAALGFPQALEHIEDIAHKAYIDHFDSAQAALKYLADSLLNIASDISTQYDYGKNIVDEIANLIQ